MSIALGFPDGSVVKNLAAKAGDPGDAGSMQVGKSLWSRKWQSTLVFLLG